MFAKDEIDDRFTESGRLFQTFITLKKYDFLYTIEEEVACVFQEYNGEHEEGIMVSRGHYCKNIEA